MKTILFIIVLIVCHSAASQAPAHTSNKPLSSDDSKHLLTLAGSNTLGAKLTPAWSHAYLNSLGAKNITTRTLQSNEYRVEGLINGEKAYIDILAHGSSTGFIAILTGAANIAMSSRKIKTKERHRLSSLGNLEDVSSEHITAIDGLAIIVHPNNPIKELSIEQIAKVFSGKVKNWSSLGGFDQKIQVLSRDHKSGTWDTFRSLVLSKKDRLTTTAKRFESNDSLSDVVFNTAGSIGFVGLASVRNSKTLAISSGSDYFLKPTKLLIATEDYPLSRRLFLYTTEKTNSTEVDNFIRFVHSKKGQDIVEEIGFVSQNPKRIHSPSETGPKVYRDLSKQAERISVNFRFDYGSADLDNKAKRDIRRLGKFLNHSNNNHLSVQLIGFSNKYQDPRLTLILSKLRATAVKLELFKYGVTTEPVLGLGSDLPLTHSNVKNNRVEVWVH